MSYEQELSITTHPTHVIITSSDENAEKDIDEILKITGSRNPLQIVIQLSTFYLFLIISYNFVLSFFTGNDPSWRCVSNNSSQFCELNYNKSISSDSDQFNHRCQIKRSEWTFTTPRNYSFVTEFDLVCDKTSVAAFVSSSYYIGGLTGSIVTGVVSDTYGRKPVLLMSLLITTGSLIGGVFVKSIWQLIGVNIVRGAASVACFFTASVYQLELVSPTYRAKTASLMLLGVSFSFLLIDGIAYFERNWRKLQTYAAIPNVLAIILFIFLPESPRWLLAIGKNRRATRILEKINKFSGNLIKFIRVKSPTDVNEGKYTYVDLCRNRKVFTTTLCIGFVWFTIAIVYYSIALESSNLGGNMYEAFAISGIADYPTSFLAYFVPDRIGRKKTILGGLTVSGILLGSVALVPQSLSCRFVVNIVIMIVARLNIGVALITIYTWTFELYPTVLRSQGISICAIFKASGLIIVPFITRVLQKVSYRCPFILMLALAIVSSIIGLMLPETNKLQTKEKYEDFFKTTPRKSSLTSGIDNYIVESIEKEEK